ncbi:MAG: type II toxin-antitoxin system VapC family toxin [Bryobacteraceae bacterium]
MTFVDTGAWVALFVEADAQHHLAREWIGSNRDRLITSDYIVDEVLTLIKARFRVQTAIRAGHVLFGQGLAGLFQLTDDDKERAWAIFRSHSDKGWSFTDCTSYALMQRMGITRAFAFDRHFSQMRGIRRVPG